MPNLLTFGSVLRHGLQHAWLITWLCILRRPSYIHKTSLTFKEQWGVFPAEILMLEGRFLSLPRIQIRSAILPHALVSQAGIVITHALSVGTSRGKFDSCPHCSLVNFYVSKRVLHQHFLDFGVHFLHRGSEDRRST